IYGDVSVGFYLAGNANYFVGVGINNLVSHRSEKISYRPTRKIAVNGGYTFSLPSLPKVEFMPTAYIETDFTTVSWSLAAMGTFNKRFWAGLSYRFQDAVSILAGMNIGKLNIGVSYDITASPFIKASSIGGAFEVCVRYCFGLEGEKVNTEYKNARYL
ncbi:MAG: type IX secretion system membrane protein PorP/SprF, partial [Bacteroidales bacterium]|nr:type IX secretion system membrane protein PorP/SprF [Bacteroidales bacterium]